MFGSPRRKTRNTLMDEIGMYVVIEGGNHNP
jgi:hypothetical protein